MARIKYTVTFPAARAGDEVTWPGTIKVYPDKDTQRPLQNRQSLDENKSFIGYSDATSVAFTHTNSGGTVTVTTGSPSGTGAAATNQAVPAGGTTGQVLQKASNTDGDVAWSTPSGGSVALADRGNWATTTAYAAGDRVVQGGVNYLCLLAHTSGTFATDLAASKWEEVGVNSASAVALSNTAAVDPAASAAAGTATAASRQDHVHRSLGLLSLFWGDGSDGAAVFDGTNAVTGATRSGSVYTLTKDVNYTNATVNVGVSVVVAGWRMYCQGTLTNNGTVHANGTNASGATGGAGGAQNHLWYGRPGKNGGTGNGTSADIFANSWFPGSGGTNGGGGGAGGASGGNTAGNGSAPQGSSHALELLSAYPTAFTGVAASTYLASSQPLLMSGGGGGGSGAGDGTNAGGGGGGGGGAFVVNARQLAGNGVFSANGGNGGNGAGGNAAGGGAGGGGVAKVNTAVSTFTGTVTASKGTGGTSQGTGGVPPTSSFSGGPSDGVALLTVWT